MRILLYILIWAVILFLPNRLLTTEPIHEYLGLIFLLLGSIHLVLVRRYLRALVTLRLRGHRSTPSIPSCSSCSSLSLQRAS